MTVCDDGDIISFWIWRKYVPVCPHICFHVSTYRFIWFEHFMKIVIEFVCVCLFVVRLTYVMDSLHQCRLHQCRQVAEYVHCSCSYQWCCACSLNSINVHNSHATICACYYSGENFFDGQQNCLPLWRRHEVYSREKTESECEWRILMQLHWPNKSHLVHG